MQPAGLKAFEVRKEYKSAGSMPTSKGARSFRRLMKNGSSKTRRRGSFFKLNRRGIENKLSGGL